MKRILLYCVIFLFIAVNVNAATCDGSKLPDLNEIVSPTNDTIIYGISDPDGIPEEGKISISNIGGSSVTYQTSDPDDTDETGFYLNTTDGDFFHVNQNVGVSTWATTYTAATSYDLTLSVVSDGTITIDSTDYTSSGSPHTITGLSGATTMTASYGGSNDTFEWSGTDSGDVTGSYPTYSITMDDDKSLTGTFSVVSSCSGTGTFGYGTVSALTGTANSLYSEFIATTDICVSTGYMRVRDNFTATEHLRIVVWNSDNTVLGISNELTGDGVSELKSVSFPSPFQISNGTTYRVGYVADAAISYYYTDSAGYTRAYNDVYSAYPDATGISWTIGSSRAVECYVGDN